MDGRCGKRERGATAVFVAVVLVAIGAFTALALNIGHGRAIRAQLQNAADAAALAGAKELDGTLTPITSASPQNVAADFSQLHETDRDMAVSLAPGDVTLGVWDPYGDPATAFTPLNATTIQQARQVNAVRVRTYRAQSHDNAVEAWFAAFTGKTTMDISAEAIAVTGGPCGGCPDVPLVFFDCGLYYDNELQCWKSSYFHAEFAPDQTDTIGFSSLSSDATASTATYMDILNHSNCAKYDTDTGKDVNVSNGNQLNPQLCGGFDQYCYKDASGTCTKPMKVRAPVVAGECDLAAGILPKFNQPHTVVGFATFVMRKLVCSGSSKYMEFEFLCEEVDPNASRIGCGFWGTGPFQPRLVR